MQDNELMVRRTIQEFNQIYRALERIFCAEREAAGSPFLCVLCSLNLRLVC